MEKSEFKKKLNEQCLSCKFRQVVKKMGSNEILKIICCVDGRMVNDWHIADDSMHKFTEECPNYTERFLASIYEKNTK